MKPPTQKYIMVEIYEEIMHVARQRWPATYQVLSVKCHTYCSIAAFGCSWYIASQCDIHHGANKLLERMDLFEEYYQELDQHYSSPLLPRYPHIAANFVTTVSKKRLLHKDKEYNKLSIYIKGKRITIGLSSDDFYGPYTDRLEAFLARLAKKREVLRPLPIPIRDAINYHL